MNTKNYITTKLLEQFFKKDLNKQIDDLRSTVKVLIEMTDNLHNAKVEVPLYKSLMETQLFKLAAHTSTLIDIFGGTNIYSPDSKRYLKYHDLSSIYVLNRTIIENYLTFHYLYVQPKNEQAEFRFYLYQLAGLSSRQNFEVSFSDIKKDFEVEISRKKDLEAEEIKKLLLAIKSNEYFLSLKKEKQNDLINNRKAKEMNWVEIIKTSNLKKEFILDQWRLYSNYAHSEMISSIQLKEYFTNPDILNPALFTACITSIIINAIAVKDLIKMYPVLNIMYNALPISTATIIDNWENFGAKEVST